MQPPGPIIRQARADPVLAGGLVALPLALVALPVTAQDRLRVHFVDVGQGDGVLIQSPSGQTVVYDGGEATNGMQAYLERVGVTQVDLVVASHNHADHIGGLPEVVRRFPPRFYIDNGVPATTLTYRRLLDAVHASGAQLLEPTARRIALADAALVILPPAGRASWEQNDNSVRVIVEYGAFRLFLGGDAESRAWGHWLSGADTPLVRVQVHKASHHGSRNGDTVAGMARLAPETVVISAGRGNGYGHPYPEALAFVRPTGGHRLPHGRARDGRDRGGGFRALHRAGRARRGVAATPRGHIRTGQAALDSGRRINGSCWLCLNTASLHDLQRIIHIAEARAQEIVALRQTRRFASVSELTRVNGIGTARLWDILAEGLACVR